MAGQKLERELVSAVLQLYIYERWPLNPDCLDLQGQDTEAALERMWLVPGMTHAVAATDVAGQRCQK